MKVSKTIEIDMGHRIPNHKSKCRSFHGHRYKIECIVDDKVISKEGDSSEGMVIDFSDLKYIMIDVIDKIYDHSFCIYAKDEFISHFVEFKKITNVNIVDFIPTAENLAKHWFELVKPRLEILGIKLYSIRVWETPTSTAEYCGE